MGVHRELDEMLKNPKCHAILINALGEYGSLLRVNGDDFADVYELAEIERSLELVDALCDVFQRWL